MITNNELVIVCCRRRDRRRSAVVACASSRRSSSSRRHRHLRLCRRQTGKVSNPRGYSLRSSSCWQEYQTSPSLAHPCWQSCHERIAVHPWKVHHHHLISPRKKYHVSFPLPSIHRYSSLSHPWMYGPGFARRQVLVWVSGSCVSEPCFVALV